MNKEHHLLIDDCQVLRDSCLITMAVFSCGKAYPNQIYDRNRLASLLEQASMQEYPRSKREVFPGRNRFVSGA